MRHSHLKRAAAGDTVAMTAARSAVRSGACWLATLVLAGLSAIPAHAQLGFTEFALTDSVLNSSPSTDFWIASAAPADVDGDGDLDLLIAGYYVVYNESVEERLTLYRNDGPVNGTTWALTPIPVDAGTLSFGSTDLAWGDYDNDGDPDVVVATEGETALYRNDAGTLVRTPTLLPGYFEDADFSTMDLHSVSWTDFDNDGDLDLLLPSVLTGYTPEPTALLRNDGPGAGGAWTFTDATAGLPVAPNAVSEWADLDGDGDLDFLLGNVSPYGDNFLNTYRNSGGTFALADSGLAYIRYGTADWGDVDNDGDLDIVYAGNIDLPDDTGETVVRILFKNAQAGYTPFDVISATGNPWLDFNAVTWADYDSDGDMDLLVSGEWLGDGEIFGRSVVYVNNGGTFTLASEPLPAPIAGQAGGAFTWFDVDGDGDLDYFVAGGYYVPNGNGLIEARTQLFRNDAVAANFRPTAPTLLSSTPNGTNGMTLSWHAALDDHTPQAALTYDLKVVALGVPAASARALPEPGNVRRNTSRSLHGLKPGTYRWTVRAMDTAFNGSSVAQGTFIVGAITATPGNGIPRAFALSSAVPSPFNPSTQFTLFVDRDQPVVVTLYDALGRRAAVLHDGPLAAGVHPFALDASKLASGAYFVRAVGREHSAVRRVTLLR
jgi:hypothetical protein